VICSRLLEEREDVAEVLGRFLRTEEGGALWAAAWDDLGVLLGMVLRNGDEGARALAQALLNVLTTIEGATHVARPKGGIDVA